MNLDSLMDILSCLVGVMLFLVIYTVLELGSATYQADIPIVRDPPNNSVRVVVICEGGTVRLLNLDQAYIDMLSGFEIVRSFDDVQLFVEGIQGTGNDPLFDFAVAVESRLATDLIGTLDFTITPKEGAVGDSIHQLDDASFFVRALDRLDPEEAWLAFTVDSASVDVYRRARDIANDRGFASRWDPGTLELPVTFALSNDPPDEWFSLTGPPVKPAR